MSALWNSPNSEAFPTSTVIYSYDKGNQSTVRITPVRREKVQDWIGSPKVVGFKVANLSRLPLDQPVDMFGRIVARQTVFVARSAPRSLVHARGVHIDNTVYHVSVAFTARHQARRAATGENDPETYLS